MPVVGAGLQGFIIGLLGVGDQLFDADIFADDITGAVQKQQCQKSAHAAVAVIEGMDAEKVQNENRDQQQRVKLGILRGRLEGIAKCCHCPRCFPRRDRLKADDLPAVRQFLGNHIIRVFEAAADGLDAVLVQIPMQLQNDRRLWRDIIVALVDRRQHVAVSGNLFFAAALGHGLLADDFFQAVVCCDDALDAVGRFGALDLRNLQEVGQRIRFGLDKEILLPLVLVNLREIGHDLRRQELIVFCFEVEISHSNSSFGVQFHQIPFNDAITVYP